MYEELSDEQYWKKKIQEHMPLFIVIIIAGAFVITGFILVIIWFIETSPIGAQGTALIGDWSLNWIVGFFILVILFELLFVGIPAGLFFGVGGYIWWKRLPDEEKAEFKAREKKNKHRKRNAGGSGGGGLVMFIAYCIYMGVQGNYYTTFSSQPYSYWVYGMFFTLMWMVIIFGIPICIILLIVYFTVWRKKSE